MSPCAGRNTIAALLAGALDASSDHATARRLEDHLDACASCRQLVADLGRGLSSLAEPRSAEASRFPRPGQRVDRYALRRLLGVGGMGVVFEAHDPTLGRKVALKLVRPDLLDPPSRPRLLDEARAMARVQHPNVVAVYDAGAFGDQIYVCMEYIAGTTLREWLAVRRRSTRDILAAFAAAGAGLAHIHRAGLVHLDFKPDNVLVAASGRFLVSDFGLTRMVGGLGGRSGRSGMIAGTPAYMAPEQKLAGPTSARTDQYGFSAALREALGDRATRRIARVTERGMSIDPRDRYPSMEALLAALGASHRERRSHRAAAIAVMTGAAALLALRTSPPTVQIVEQRVVVARDPPAAAPAQPEPDTVATSAALLVEPPAPPRSRGIATTAIVVPDKHRWLPEQPRLVEAVAVEAIDPVAAPCDDDTALLYDLDPPHCPTASVPAVRDGSWSCVDPLTCDPISASRANTANAWFGLMAMRDGTPTRALRSGFLGPAPGGGTSVSGGTGANGGGGGANGGGGGPNTGGTGTNGGGAVGNSGGNATGTSGGGGTGGGSDGTVCNCGNGVDPSTGCGCAAGDPDCSCGTSSGTGNANSNGTVNGGTVDPGTGNGGVPSSGNGSGTSTACNCGVGNGTGTGNGNADGTGNGTGNAAADGNPNSAGTTPAP